MTRQYFGTDGIRGTVGVPPITPDFVLRLAHAVGRVLKRSQERPIVLIAGGSDKGIPFDPIAPLVAEKVKTLILMGPTASKIEEAVRRGGYAGPIQRAAGMDEAVALARAAAAPGDCVLLSPACASFDAYRNFEERGCHFKSLVEALQ